MCFENTWSLEIIFKIEKKRIEIFLYSRIVRALERKNFEKQVYSGIGGQAVIEGIMMKNKEDYSVAVRKPDGSIDVIQGEYLSLTDKYPFFRLPFFTGNFILLRFYGVGDEVP